MITIFRIVFRVLADFHYLQSVCFFLFFFTVDQISLTNFCHTANTHFPSKYV